MKKMIMMLAAVAMAACAQAATVTWEITGIVGPNGADPTTSVYQLIWMLDGSLLSDWNAFDKSGLTEDLLGQIGESLPFDGNAFSISNDDMDGSDLDATYFFIFANKDITDLAWTGLVGPVEVSADNYVVDFGDFATATAMEGGHSWLSSGPGNIPEPTSGLLLLLGMAGLALKRKVA